MRSTTDVRLARAADSGLSKPVKVVLQETDEVLANPGNGLIEVSLGSGPGAAVVLGSDLTAEYVRENADYRS